jgi:coenzyme PQQ precursor peptide PqqA
LTPQQRRRTFRSVGCEFLEKEAKKKTKTAQTLRDMLTGSEKDMKLQWHRPEVVEQEVGLEVTSYLPAELDKS